MKTPPTGNIARFAHQVACYASSALLMPAVALHAISYFLTAQTTSAAMEATVGKLGAATHASYGFIRLFYGASAVLIASLLVLWIALSLTDPLVQMGSDSRSQKRAKDLFMTVTLIPMVYLVIGLGIPYLANSIHAGAIREEEAAGLLLLLTLGWVFVANPILSAIELAKLLQDPWTEEPAAPLLAEALSETTAAE